MGSATPSAARRRSPASRTASASASAGTCSAKGRAESRRSAAPTTARDLGGEAGSIELASPLPRPGSLHLAQRRDLRRPALRAVEAEGPRVAELVAHEGLRLLHRGLERPVL